MFSQMYKMNNGYYYREIKVQKSKTYFLENYPDTSYSMNGVLEMCILQNLFFFCPSVVFFFFSYACHLP